MSTWFNFFDSDQIKSIVTNVLSQYVYLVTGPFTIAGIIYFIKFSKNRLGLARRVLGIPNSARDVTVIFGIIPPAKNAKKGYFSVEEGDVSALMNVSGLLRDLIRPRKPAVLSHIDADSALVNCKYIVSISGPVWNPVTAHLLENFKHSIHFDLDSECLVTPSGTLNTTYSKNGVPTECYGMICRSSRKTSKVKKQTCLVVCGNSNLSTLGSAVILDDIDYYLKKQIGFRKAYLLSRKSRFCLVVKVTNTAATHSHNRLPYRNGLIDVEIAQVIS